MLGKVFESLYSKVFINIIVKSSTTVIGVGIYSKDGEISHEEQTFKSTYLTAEIYDYIEEFTKESPYYYISFLDPAKEQGAIPTCDKQQLPLYHDLSTCEFHCIDKQWGYFTSKTELYNLERGYEDTGIDFVFSPFAVLYNFFQDKIDSHYAMYILLEENYISLAVFEHSQLVFAEHLDMEMDTEADNISLDDLEDDEKDLDLALDDDGIILDDIDVDDALDDFADIEDLDSLEDIDEFSDAKDIEEELYENKLMEEENDLKDEIDTSSHFNEDYQRFSLIQNAMNHFYKDEKYESKFIENVYIADSTKVSPDLKRYLEEEMFLNVYIRHTDLCTELCELAKQELGL